MYKRQVKDINLLDYTIEQTKKFKINKKNFVVFGTGGSNLGARALINTLIELPNNILFFDNIDPLFFQNEIINLDLNTTGFIIISKSGTTPETLSQFGSIRQEINEQFASEKNTDSKVWENETEILDSIAESERLRNERLGIVDEEAQDIPMKKIKSKKKKRFFFF